MDKPRPITVTHDAILIRKPSPLVLIGALLMLVTITVLLIGLLRQRQTVIEAERQRQAELIAVGVEVYAANCAMCHGRQLQGGMGPPHNATGHTWEHSDAFLYQRVMDGQPGRMPAFGSQLTDDQIEAVLAYIKSTWTNQQRHYQQKQSQ